MCLVPNYSAAAFRPWLRIMMHAGKLVVTLPSQLRTLSIVSPGYINSGGTDRSGMHRLRNVSFEGRIIQGTFRTRTKVRGRTIIAPVKASLQPTPNFLPEAQAASSFIQLSYLCISCFSLFLLMYKLFY
jgi:hypothetical protein